MTDEQITALVEAKRWAFSLPREQFEMTMAISLDASHKGGLAGAAEERARIVAWLRDNMPSSMADLNYEADAIEAGEHTK
jgi:hypothetical protein